MAYLLGWKDILRPIRDGYRHLFPSPDTGPTPEERRKQRSIDRLKGFTYFDTFEQLETWTDAEIDPLQRANTPLLARFPNETEELAKASVLICHDYAGNYHTYEGASAVGLKERKYACQYLQHVDTFIYFSHKLVCVPPPTWTNTLHRNGVKALGTILIEPQMSNPERLFLRGGEEKSFPLATKLAEMADRYGFDGWLVNIEKTFPTLHWDVQLLASFLHQLRTDLGVDKQLIWYDALTTSNKVSYQNGFNAENALFVKACGNILTNYCWKEKNAMDSIDEALQQDVPLQHIYFGIDVWAQNATKLSQPRVTYPEYGGGGTNTGIAIAKLAELGLAAGIFAPAWTFEHFPDHGSELEQTVWNGRDLPNDVTCSCGDCDERHRPNGAMPVDRFAKLNSAGSRTFFFTDFSRAFCTHGTRERERLFQGHELHAQLGSQSIEPLRKDFEGVPCHMQHRTEDIDGRSQLIIETRSPPFISVSKNTIPTGHNHSMPLFKLNMPADGSLRLRISYRDFSSVAQGTCFYMKISGTTYKLAQSDPRINDLVNVEVRASNAVLPINPRLEELGFYSLASNAMSGTKLAEVDYICIQPVGSYLSQAALSRLQDDNLLANSSLGIESDNTSEAHSIFNIHIASRDGSGQVTRLCWGHNSNVQPVQGMPYSVVTGPFSYFAIHIDDVVLGRAYAAEHELPASFVAQCAGCEVPVCISGIGFDGQELASASTKIQF